MTRPISGLLVLVATLPLTAAEPKFTPEQVAFYEKDVKPLLVQHCLKCHGADEKKIKGELRLNTRALILKGGDTGPAVSLDKPAESLLLLAITKKRPDDADVMPPSGKLSDKDIATLTKWVNEKLPVTPGDLGVAEATETKSVVTEEAKKFWFYQPIRKPAVPANGAKNPVDAFLNDKLAAKKLTANGPADKVALIRRVYYDLIGLPPTPEQVDAFVKDASPKSYETLIDTLLASPQYGEKWGRHWLDIVRYAETNGYERDGIKPHAWKYRDYVIRSFNADKPYSTFVKEQLAGDEMPAWSADNIIATGFYRLGIWDDEPADKMLSLYDGYDDLVTVVGQGMLGMSLNCARCHDHKRDPIAHADYYRFLAFFRDIPPFSDTRNTNSSNNSADVTPPEKRKVYEAELASRDKAMKDLKAQMKPIEDAAIKKMPPADQLAVDDGKRDEIVKKVPRFLEGDAKAEYARMKRQLTDLEKKPMPSQEFAMAVNQCNPKPPMVYVLARGNPNAPKEKEPCPPGFPSVLSLPDPTPKQLAKSSGRRTALAEWITAKENPLTARVLVNRLWQHHFGKGIVGSPNDFGKLGELPTHPELLDWLASDFMENGWTLKRMHKLLMLSDAYQRSSVANESNFKIDPANALYWRFNMRRLGAEEVRDSMLNAAGLLKLDQFGPSVYPKIPREVLAGQSVPGQGWQYDKANPTAANRRSIYVHVKRALQVPILVAHDQADTDSSCPVRYTTTVPTQALSLMNGEFAHETAAALAARLLKESPSDVTKQVMWAVRLTTGREPKPEEVAKDAAFVKRMMTEHKLDAAAALQRYCLLILNANEFVYID
ncbi:PSD1 and planctomycete cytochrome C domain-containing protein [soil metagenome]